MVSERLSLRKAKKELAKIEDSQIDDDILEEMTPEGRSLAIRVMKGAALNGLAIEIANRRKRKTD